jgi:NAD-dependent dihydropyrimidine dehydrogenase PreA subunit
MWMILVGAQRHNLTSEGTMKPFPYSLKFKPSTRAFLRDARRIRRREEGSQDYSIFDWLHGYVYARWPYLYIGVGTGEHPLAKRFGPGVIRLARRVGRLKQALKPADRSEETEPDSQKTRQKVTFADTYHGKVVPLQAAQQLVKVNEEIRLENLETIIPYARARDLILKNPDHIVALECPCRLARANPCLPLDVCLIVGEPFASFVNEHHPQRSRWISREEAVGILQAEDRRGHVHHAFFKDAMLGRFYAICNCCECCCGAIQAQKHGTPMLTSSGYLAQVNPNLCIGCQTCREGCQFGALKLAGNVMSVQEAKCMGCGICVTRCQQEAISLRLAPEKGEPLEILSLMGLKRAL